MFFLNKWTCSQTYKSALFDNYYFLKFMYQLQVRPPYRKERGVSINYNSSHWKLHCFNLNQLNQDQCNQDSCLYWLFISLMAFMVMITHMCQKARSEFCEYISIHSGNQYVNLVYLTHMQIRVLVTWFALRNQLHFMCNMTSFLPKLIWTVCYWVFSNVSSQSEFRIWIVKNYKTFVH